MRPHGHGGLSQQEQGQGQGGVFGVFGQSKMGEVLGEQEQQQKANIVHFGRFLFGLSTEHVAQLVEGVQIPLKQ